MPASPILGGHGVSRSKNAEDSQAINLFLEVIDGKDGAAPGFMMATPGLGCLINVGPGPIRGPKIGMLGGIAIVVSGNQVWAVSASLQTKYLGTIGTSAGPISCISNDTQFAVFDGAAGFLTTLAVINSDAGGYPMIWGTISAGGQQYAIGDTIYLKQTGGVQDATASIVVTSVAVGVVTGFRITTPGVFPAQPTSFTQASTSGSGSGLVLVGPSYAAVTGGFGLTAAYVYTAGSSYTVGDTVTLAQTGGSQTTAAIITISATEQGAVTGFYVEQQGLFSAQPTDFKQDTTTGSGAGFKLTSPTFALPIYLSQINLPFAGGPYSASYQDGFGVVNDALSNTWWQSNSYDLSVWQPLVFADADGQPGNILTIVAMQRQQWLLKETSVEVWVNAGQAGFTFQRLDGVFIEAGIAAPASAGRADHSLLWLSRAEHGKGIVMMAEGLVPKPVSTHAFSAEVDYYATIADAFGLVYQQGGHVFYQLTFPTADTTWVFDLTTSAKAGAPVWHKRAAFSDDRYDNGVLHRHWANAYGQFPTGLLSEGPVSQDAYGQSSSQTKTFFTLPDDLAMLPRYWPNYENLGASPSGNGDLCVCGPLIPAPHLIGDYRNGNLYYFDPDWSQDNQTPRKWIRTWRAVAKPSTKPQRFNCLTITMQTGSTTIIDDDPQVQLRWSDDGGHTWSQPLMASVGQLGQTSRRVVFRRLGSTRNDTGLDRIFELSSTDSFNVALIAAEVE